MVTDAQKQELIAAISRLEDERLVLEIKDLLALAEARARGDAKPRAYAGFGGEAARLVQADVARYESGNPA